MRASPRFASTPLARTAAAALLACAATACNDTFRIGSAGPAALAARSDQLFESFANRFAPNEFSPKVNATRQRLAQNALTPSRIFNDTLLWDARPSPAHRDIFMQGYLATDGKYYVDHRPSLAAPTHLGETRHTITLDQLGSNVYRWTTRVDMGIGSIAADDARDIWIALLTSPAGRTEKELRDDYRAAFPRAAEAFGRGFSLDSLRTTPGALGTTSVSMTFGYHPDQMRAAYPALAGYLDKYLGPAKYHLVLAERAGNVVFEVTGRDRTLTLKYRVQQGKLVNLLGPPRAWSDSLQLTADVSLKVKVFTVGFHKLVTDFIIGDAPHDRSWTIVAQHEPDWDLPLMTERLVRSPLRRPFEGQGSMFRLDVRDSAGGLSQFSRSGRLDVQESAITHFIGSLSSHLMGDINDKVEGEEHRFLRDGFVALQADLKALRK